MDRFKQWDRPTLYDDPMQSFGYVLTLLAGLIHVYIFTLESITWQRPSSHRLFGVRDEAQMETLTQVMFNQGFYNLFLAVGAIGGAVLGLGDSRTGETLSLYTTTFMVGAAIVLIGSNAKMVRAALVQGLIPAIAFVLVLLG